MKRLGWGMMAALMLLFFGRSWAQDEAGITLDIIGVDATDLSSVTVNVSVLDASGQLVSGLEADNFSVGGDLADRATIRRVENVTDDGLAFASVLVIDTSSSMSGRPLEQTQAAARSYVGALGPDDTVALVIFDSTFQVLVDYTTDKARLVEVIDQLYAGGQTALYDANRLGIEHAIAAPLPRKAVIILSDGGEFGNVSRYSREESIHAATIQGVPVYTVGLGWHIDERFLEAVSGESNAIFYNSPDPDELVDIYNHLAHLFRTQYIITLDAAVDADGARYSFTLNVSADDGQTASGEAVLRAPIPIPLLSLPPDLFDDALAESTEVKVEIRADQDIADVRYALNGEFIAVDESFIIDPASLAPGDYTLDIAVSDVDGDTSWYQTDFEVAALPPDLTTDFAPEDVPLTEAELISVSAGGQTEITAVEFIVDESAIKIDSEPPYDFSLEPFDFSPGEHTLTIRASNTGGQSASIDRPFTAAVLPPRIEVNVDGLTSETALEDSLTGRVSAVGQSPIASLSLDTEPVIESGDGQLEFSLDAADFPPGRAAIDITAVDESGAESTETISFEVAALAPTVELEGLADEEVMSGDTEIKVLAGGQTDIARIEVAYNDGAAAIVRDGAFTIPAETLGEGQHELSLTVTNASGQTTTLTRPFDVDLPPTPTATLTSTSTATDAPTATDTASPTATDTAVPTATASSAPTVTVTPILAAAVTVIPTATDTDAPTATATHTLTPTATDTDVPTATSTFTPTATDTDVPTATSTLTPTATDTEAPTATATHTLTPTPTDTEVPTATNTFTPTATDTDVPTATSTLTPTATDTDVPTATSTLTPTATDTDVPTATSTLTPTATDTEAPTATATHTLTPTATDTDVPTATATHTFTPTATDTEAPTATSTFTPTATDTDVPTATSTLTPTATDTDVPTATSTFTPTATDTDVPTATSTFTPTPTDTAVPTATATHTLTPTATDTEAPTATATHTLTPTATDTEAPTATSTFTPTATDTDVPTATSTFTPTATDTDVPTATATHTFTPTATDTEAPTATATHTFTPTPTDTDVPTATATHTLTPTPTDTDVPTATATHTFTPTPTEDATETAIAAVIDQPTEAPTEAEVADPTAQPSLTPVTITEVEAPSADEPPTRDSIIAIAAVAAGLLLLLILFLMSRIHRD